MINKLEGLWQDAAVVSYDVSVVVPAAHVLAIFRRIALGE